MDGVEQRGRRQQARCQEEGEGGGEEEEDENFAFEEDRELIGFLTEHGLLGHRNKFEAAEVDLDALWLMDDEDLKEIGLTQLGPRKKLLHLIKQKQEEKARRNAAAK